MHGPSWWGYGPVGDVLKQHRDLTIDFFNGLKTIAKIGFAPTVECVTGLVSGYAGYFGDALGGASGAFMSLYPGSEKEVIALQESSDWAGYVTEGFVYDTNSPAFKLGSIGGHLGGNITVAAFEGAPLFPAIYGSQAFSASVRSKSRAALGLENPTWSQMCGDPYVYDPDYAQKFYSDLSDLQAKEILYEGLVDGSISAATTYLTSRYFKIKWYKSRWSVRKD